MYYSLLFNCFQKYFLDLWHSCSSSHQNNTFNFILNKENCWHFDHKSYSMQITSLALLHFSITCEIQLTKCFFRCHQSNVRQVFPAYEYCRTLFCCLTVHNDLITVHAAVVGSWEDMPNVWLTVVKNPFVGWALNFRICMLVKGAVTSAIKFNVNKSLLH